MKNDDLTSNRNLFPPDDSAHLEVLRANCDKNEVNLSEMLYGRVKKKRNRVHESLVRVLLSEKRTYEKFQMEKLCSFEQRSSSE